jgi:hypothetical protein
VKASRWLATSVSALIALAVAATPAMAAPTPAAPAGSFVDSIGVNVHLGFEGTPYVERLPLVEQRLEELGIRHVRTGFYPAAPGIDAAIRELGAAGIGSDLIMGSPLETPGGLPRMLADVKASLLGSVDSLEGPNEYSTSGDGEWKAHLVAYQEQLYDEAKADPALASLPVLGPSIVHGDQAALGDVSAFLDRGNIHSYPEGEGPQYKLEYFLRQAALNSGAKPIVATETGYTNALGWTPSGPGEQRPISEAAAAVYFPRLYLEYWSHGIGRTYAYQLLDEHEDASLENREDHFGLLRHDLSPKPAAVAIGNLIALLADPGPAFTPGSLEYTLAGGTPPVKSVLLEKHDGAFYLALWRQQSVWNSTTKQPIAAAPEPLKVSFPGGEVGYAVYEPSVSSAPQASGGPTATVNVEVGAGVTVLKLTPTPKAPPQQTGGDPGTGSSSAPVTGLAQPAVVGATMLPLPIWSAPRCVVPELRGLTVPAAKAKARRGGCDPLAAAVSPASGKGLPRSVKPRVVRTEPKAGTVLAAGAAVRIDARRYRQR